MQRPTARRAFALSLLVLTTALIGCGGVSVAICGDWWCVGTPIPPPCYYCFSLSATGADLDGDGSRDAIYLDERDRAVRVRLGDGAGGLGTEGTYPLGLARVDTLRVGDFNGDGVSDVAFLDFLARNVQVLLGNGAGALPTQGAVFPIAGMQPLVDTAVGRINGDTSDDLILLDQGAGVLVLLADGAGSFTFAPAGRQVLPQGGTQLDAGLIDGDAIADLAVVDEQAWTLCTYGGAATGAFTPFPGSLVPTRRPGQPLLTELDGVAGLDLAVLSTAQEAVELWFGAGTGAFTPSPQGPLATGVDPSQLLAEPEPAAPAGPAHLVVNGRRGFQGALAVFVNNGGGVFATPAQQLTLPVTPGPALITNLDGDARSELIVFSAEGIAIGLGGPAQD